MSRGINNITLYENKNISITYLNDTTIQSITTGGETIEIDSCYIPEYETEIKRGENNKDIYEREIRFQMPEHENEETINTILDSYYGWIAVIEGEEKYAIIDPLHGEESEEDWQKGVNYGILLKHDEDSTNQDIAYV